MFNHAFVAAQEVVVPFGLCFIYGKIRCVTLVISKIDTYQLSCWNNGHPKQLFTPKVKPQTLLTETVGQCWTTESCSAGLGRRPRQCLVLSPWEELSNRNSRCVHLWHRVSVAWLPRLKVENALFWDSRRNSQLERRGWGHPAWWGFRPSGEESSLVCVSGGSCTTTTT